MKIAYVVPYVPNLIRTRSYNLINQLVALGNKVVVFTLGSGHNDREDAAILRSKVAGLYYQEQPILYSLWNIIKALPSQRPLQTVYSWNKVLADKLVKDISDDQNGFDVVHIEHLRGSKYGQYIKAKMPHVPLVWDSVDCISYLFRQASTHSRGGFGRFVTRFELGRTSQMEGKLISEFDHVLVTSDVDRSALLRLTSSGLTSAPVNVLPNGVDLEYFYPEPGVQKDPETLVFSGKMSYHANVSMAKYLISEIMPMVWKIKPNVRLIIVGKDPTSDIRALGIDPRIVVTGTVDDIRPFLWRATMAVVPLVYGAGIQNKVLEAMACGTPVITTSNSLLSLQAVPGQDLLISDGVAEFSNCVIKLLKNRDLQTEVGYNGAAYIKKHHNWVDITKQLLVYYNEAIIG